MGPDTEAFGGQYKADAFSAFAKLLVYAGAGVTLIVAPAFFDRVARCGRNSRCWCCSRRWAWA
jgi:hypothetical protein